MSIAEGSTTIGHLIEESTYGTSPVEALPGTAATAIRMTGENLNFSPNTIQSAELSPTADVTDLIDVGGATEGGFNFELSYGAPFHTLLEHALRGSFSSNVLDGAVESKSLTIEKVFDVGGSIVSFRFPGLRVNTLSLNIQPRQIVNGTVDFRGLKPVVGATQFYGTPDAANTGDIMSASDVGTITVGGITGTFNYTDLSVQLTNNLRELAEIGDDDPVDIRYGQREITGRFVPYFNEDGANVYNALVNGTPFSIQIPLSDGTDSYTLEFPVCKFSSGNVLAGGNNTDVLADMSFTALRGALTSPTGISSIRITRTS